MSHSTTTTSVFVLQKYSRLYPSAVRGGDTTQGIQPEPGAGECWQHYTSPVLRVVLDIRKFPSKELESVRLRVIWSIANDPGGSENAMEVDQHEIAFESMDLLAFSSNTQKNTHDASGLPLKAVYRDTMVGIRYQYPKVPLPGTASVYRRFQVTFVNATEAAYFIDLIRPVCPCKSNVPSTTGASSRHLLPTATPMPPFRVMKSPGVAASCTPRENLLSHATRSPAVQTRILAQSPDPFPPSSSNPIDRRSETFPPSSSLLTSLDVRPAQHPGPSSYRPSPLGSGEADSDGTSLHPMQVDTQEYRPNGSSRTNPSHLASKNGTNFSTERLPLRTSPPPCLSSTYAPLQSAMPPPPLPVADLFTRDRSNSILLASHPLDTGAAADQRVIRDEVFDHLRKSAPSFYKMARPDLEACVADVVREPGFAQLLELMDTMMHVKGFLHRL